MSAHSDRSSLAKAPHAPPHSTLHLIAQRLSAASGLAVTVVDTIASTNSALLDSAAHSPMHPQPPCALLALSQSAGRGRRAREWVNAPVSAAARQSPAHSDLTGVPAFLGSLAVCTQLSLAHIALLPLHIGVALAQQLRVWGCPAQLKWPNDLVLATPAGSAKIGGILLETRTVHPAGVASIAVVMGCGLNWLSAPPIQDRLAACAAPFAPLAPDAESVFAGLLRAIHLGWQRSASQAPCDFAPFDALFNCAVELHPPVNGVSHGIARGIDTRGHLGIDTARGRVWVNSGEVSVRASLAQASLA